MYGKLFNRLRRSCHNVSNSSRTVRTSPSKNLPAVSSSNSPKNYNDKNNNPDQASSTNYHTYGNDLLDEDSSSDDLNFPYESVRSQNYNDSNEVSDSSSNNSFISTVTKQTSDQYWIGFVNGQPYKNWLKVGLALRSVCDFLSPLLDEIVHEMHSNLLTKHGYAAITQEQVDKYKRNTNESDVLRGWVRDVLNLHRHSISPGEIFRISRVVKWPTSDGAWEIARVFMSKAYRTGGDGNDVAAFDVSALLNFMYRCRLVDGYVHDFETVKNVLNVRNNIMHNPNLQVDNNELDESFEYIFALVQDTYLQKHVEKFLSTENYYDSLQKIKSEAFDLITSAKHSLNVLNDEAFNAENNESHPSFRTLALVKDALPKILSLPNVEVSADLNKIQSQISEMENKVTKEYEEAEKKIQQISDHVLHMNQKLDHLREVLNQASQTKLQSQIASGSKRKRKWIKGASDEETSVAAVDESKTVPSSILMDNSLQKKSAAQLVPEKHVRFDKKAILYKKNCDGASDCSCSSLETEDSEASEGSSSDLPSTSSSNYYQCKKRAWSSSDDEDGGDHDNSVVEHGPFAKKKKNGNFGKEIDNYKAKPGDLIVLPQRKRGSSSSDGGNNTFCKHLQSFLKKQPNNDGATFSTKMNLKNKYFSSVVFESFYAVASPVLSSSAEKAKQQAAFEAVKKLNTSSEENIPLNKAKDWLDAYSRKRCGKPPNFTCFKINSDLYESYVHLLPKSLLENEKLQSKRIFVETSCNTMDPDVNVEESVLKSALQGTEVEEYYHPDMHSLLNEYCLANEATLPIMHVTSSINPKTGKLLRSCVLKSFLRENLFTPDSRKKQSMKDPPKSDLAQIDLYEAKSTQNHRNKELAEENAATNMLKSLNFFSESYLSQIQGLCKAELNTLAKELDLSIAYHTRKIVHDENQRTAVYSCVVTSLCLSQTKDSFTVSSDKAGFNTEDEACESAARNAVLLLGMDIVLTS